MALFIFVIFVLLLPIHLIFDFRKEARIRLRVLFFTFEGEKIRKGFLTSEDKKSKKEVTKKAKPVEKQKKSKRPTDLLGFAEFLVHIASVLGGALKDFLSKSKVNLKELYVSIGTDDAARTALLCSGVIQAANGLFALLQQHSNFVWNQEKLSITPDFLSDKSKVSLHLDLSSSVYHLIGVYLRANIRFFE